MSCGSTSRMLFSRALPPPKHSRVVISGAFINFLLHNHFVTRVSPMLTGAPNEVRGRSDSQRQSKGEG
jgi:hypothetical protein